MILHKLRRTFVAMFWGWVMCNVIACSALGIWIGCSGASLISNLILYTLLALFYSGVLVVAAWLIALFPTDILISDSSHLRKPHIAAACGAVGGFASIVMFRFAIWVAASHEANSITEDLEWLFVFGLLAAITGLTAALHVVLKHPRTTR